MHKAAAAHQRHADAKSADPLHASEPAKSAPGKPRYPSPAQASTRPAAADTSTKPESSSCKSGSNPGTSSSKVRGSAGCIDTSTGGLSSSAPPTQPGRKRKLPASDGESRQVKQSKDVPGACGADGNQSHSAPQVEKAGVSIRSDGNSATLGEAVHAVIRDMRSSLKGKKSQTLEREFGDRDHPAGWSFKMSARADGKTIDMQIRDPYGHQLRSMKEVDRALQLPPRHSQPPPKPTLGSSAQNTASQLSDVQSSNLDEVFDPKTGECYDFGIPKDMCELRTYARDIVGRRVALYWAGDEVSADLAS